MPLPFETTRFQALKKLATERFGRINPAEDKVLRLTASSEALDYTESKEQPEIRAPFLRWLMTDKDAGPNIDSLGLRVANSTISSRLDLDFCKLSFPINFFACTFKGEVSLLRAQIPVVYFTDCKIEGDLIANGITTSGGFNFGSLEAIGYVDLTHAQIGGDLQGQHATLKKTPYALSVDGAKIAQDVLLNLGFQSYGTVSLANSEIGGDLNFTHASLKATGRGALDADDVKVGRNVYLNSHFIAGGSLSFLRAEIGGDMTCDQGLIPAMNCREMRLGGTLFWTNLQNPTLSSLSLSGANVGALQDDRGSWPAKGKLHVQDFIYGRLILQDRFVAEDLSETPFFPIVKLSAQDRVEWLERQPDGEIESPQPWMQLAKLLEAGGDSDEAKHVVYQYHRQHARLANPRFQLLSLPYDRLEEQPLWSGLPILTLGLVGSFFFWRAKRIRAMAPTDKDALAEFEKSKPVPAGYPPFNPVVYALENVLPVIKLGQDGCWAPNHLAPPGSWLPSWPNWLPGWVAWVRPLASRWKLTRWFFRLSYRRLAFLRWTLIFLGWASALILVAAIGDRFKR